MSLQDAEKEYGKMLNALLRGEKVSRIRMRELQLIIHNIRQEDVPRGKQTRKIY